jgi:hypothetical protein
MTKLPTPEQWAICRVNECEITELTPHPRQLRRDIQGVHAVKRRVRVPHPNMHTFINSNEEDDT